MSGVLNFFKDLIISLLILGCIVLLLIVFYYDKISITKSIPEADYFTLTKDMQLELGEKDVDETEEVVIKYYINSKDLEKYEKNNEYDKGKSNPFADVIDINENTNKENENSSSSSTTGNDNNNSGFYPDDGTK